MKKPKRRQRIQIGLIVITLLSAMAVLICVSVLQSGQGGSKGNSDNNGYESTGFMPAVAGNYDSVDTAAVVKCDSAAQTITFLNIELGKRYTLNYDGATVFTNKYGQGIAVSQLTDGSIVDVTFMRMRKRLNTLQVSSESFSIDKLENFKPENGGKSVVVRGEKYSIAKGAVIILPRGIGELMDVSVADSVRICGLDHTIYSITVERGHGYLRIENSAGFEGGWIQLGEDLVYQIQKDLLLPVPAGDYTAYISKDGVLGEEKLHVGDGEEISMDLSKYQKEPLYGGIVFTVEPPDANVYIDGEKADISGEIELSYGLHQMVVTAPGYESVSRYIRVAEEHASLGITLVRNGEAVRPSATPTPTVSVNSVSVNNVSANSVSSNSASNNAAPVNTVPTPTPVPATSTDVVTPGVYYVTVESPTGVEVYLDGNYIGISPIKFEKKAGTYVVTLRKSGYQTRSYTISVDSEKKDISYSFSDLLAIEN